MKQDVVLFDVIKEVCASMRVVGISDFELGVSNINFEGGRLYDVINNLIEKDESTNFKDTKFPLIAMMMPIKEERGLGLYASARIERIVIGTLTTSTDKVSKRYETGGTFKSILYPCYYEFLKRLAMHKNVSNSDPDNFRHNKSDNPGNAPLKNPAADYLDTIEITNLELTLIQIKTC